MEELEIFQIVNLLGLVIGLIFGAVAQKTQFCFSGSIKDYMLTKSTMRAASVVVAMITAVVSTQILAYYMDFDFKETIYQRDNLNYFTLVLGSAMFGIGMTMADGCSNRHLIKFAQGDGKSFLVIIVSALFALATLKGFLYGYLSPIINHPTLLEYSSIIGNILINVYVLLAFLIVLLIVLVRKMKRVFQLYDGVIIGLLVAFAWYITGFYKEESFERIIQFTGITFVNPNARTIELFVNYEVREVTFAISMVLGVVIGAFIMSRFNKKYSFGCTSNQGQNRTKYNIIGAALMGVGGILSLGCTVGQGVTGLSTLAFASFLAIVTIFVFGIITAKILKKRDELPMCFIFEWKDKDKDIEYHI